MRVIITARPKVIKQVQVKKILMQVRLERTLQVKMKQIKAKLEEIRPDRMVKMRKR